MYLTVDRPKASYQLDLNERKGLEANLIQALEILRPKDWMIAELKEKLLAQKSESSLLIAPHQRQQKEILNGKFNMKIQLTCTLCFVIYSYQAMVCVC